MVSCQQNQGKRYFNKTINSVKKELFINDTTWHNSRYESTLTRCVSIYETNEKKMDDVVEEFKKYYTLIYYGGRDAVCEAFNSPEKTTDNQLLYLPHDIIGYATDYTKVAIFTDGAFMVLIGYHEYYNTIAIYEPYAELNR